MWPKILWMIMTTVTVVKAVQVQISNHWVGGFSGHVAFSITKSISDWSVHVIFDRPIQSLENSDTIVTKLSNYEFQLHSKASNREKHIGDVLNISFIGHANGDIQPKACAYIAGINNNDCPRSSVSSVANSPMEAGSPSKNYSEALRLSILFYYAQRSGKLPADNPIPWRHDSALNDCVQGGWYDAGDHVKFGFPFAGTLTVLLWGLNRFRDGYVAAGQLDRMYDTVKWGLDYLIKAWNPSTQQLVIQVGDGDIDHKFWGRPEEMKMVRPCVKISPAMPGSDVAGETAAALAAGAIAFKVKGDANYAKKLLETAESIYQFALAHRKKFSDNSPTQAGVQSWYYASSGDRDEMCEAAAWLYKATNESKYLADATKEHQSITDVEYSWNEKMSACQLLLFEETGRPSYRQEVEAFLQTWLPGSRATTYSPCGFAWKQAANWGSCRHVSNVAFLALVAAEDGIQVDLYRKWAAEQINYILGDNSHAGGCFSYEIGYGAKYPLQPHHRAASCPNLPAQCTEANLHVNAPSPHILYGGLVGGPIATDGYNDTREDYVHNEVATDYNAGFQSAVAGLSHLVFKKEFPVTQNKCPCSH